MKTLQIFITLTLLWHSLLCQEKRSSFIFNGCFFKNSRNNEFISFFKCFLMVHCVLHWTEAKTCFTKNIQNKITSALIKKISRERKVQQTVNQGVEEILEGIWRNRMNKPYNEFWWFPATNARKSKKKPKRNWVFERISKKQS